MITAHDECVDHHSRRLPWMWNQPACPKESTATLILLSVATRYVLCFWREFVGIVLERNSLEIIDEEAVMRESTEFTCRNFKVCMCI